MSIQAPTQVTFSGSPKEINFGETLLAEGKMATVVLAGGQGSRLGFDHPKGMFQISPVKHKSLFQIISEKTLAASIKAKTKLQIAFMTSPQNDLETRKFFQENKFFGLSQEQVTFFIQAERPLEALNGTELSQVASDGNGGVFKELVRQKVYSTWKDQGVEWINIILIDNALADPFDSNLLGFSALNHLDVAVKCTYRKNADERVGILFERDGHLQVIEYSEVSDSERELSDFANLSLFCLTMNFCKTLSDKDFPLHKALKPLSKNSDEKVWKIEKFIFDLLDFTKKSQILVYPRGDCFAPLKNKEGDDSPETVRRAIVQRDLKQFEMLCGYKPDLDLIELSARYLYPTKELIKALSKHPPDLSSSYLE